MFVVLMMLPWMGCWQGSVTEGLLAPFESLVVARVWPVCPIGGRVRSAAPRGATGLCSCLGTGSLGQHSEDRAPELPRGQRLVVREELQAAGAHLDLAAYDLLARQVHRKRATEVGGRGIDDREVPLL